MKKKNSPGLISTISNNKKSAISNILTIIATSKPRENVQKKYHNRSLLSILKSMLNTKNLMVNTNLKNGHFISFMNLC